MAGTTAGSASTSPESVHNPACVKLLYFFLFFAGQPRVRGHDGRHDDELCKYLT